LHVEHFVWRDIAKKVRASATHFRSRVPQVPPSGCSADGADAGRLGEGHMTALIVGLISIVVVWLVVIYGSIYVNKNVQ
jgi:hypothetical protein